MRTLSIILLIGFISSAAFAETITFKDGRTLKGKIVQQDNSQVKVDLKGVTMTYYTDEIQDIDGKSLVTEPPPVVAKAVVVEPASVAEPREEKTVPAVEDLDQKRNLVLQFIDVFGTRKAMTDNFNSIINELAKQKPEEAQNIRDKFKIDEVIERLIPYYEKRFSSEDLQAYIDFYASEKGKKLTSSIGLVMKDSVQVGTEYIKEKFPELGQ